MCLRIHFTQMRHPVFEPFHIPSSQISITSLPGGNVFPVKIHIHAFLAAEPQPALISKGFGASAWSPWATISGRAAKMI